MIEFPLSSGNLLGAKYDEETGELIVDFVSGSRYVYSGVPIGVVEELQAAPSAGRYFHRQIRDVYLFRREI